MAKSRVLCTSSHAVDLDDGRVLGPGETAIDVDVEDAHNALLLTGGLIRVFDSAPKTWETRNPEQTVAQTPPEAVAQGTTPPEAVAQGTTPPMQPTPSGGTKS
jgi:hypothetical protein